MLDVQLRALKPKEEEYFVNDGDGLYIRVRPTGTKSFVLRRKVNGKTIRTTLGQYPETSLKKARNLAGAERLKDKETKRDRFNFEFLQQTDVRTFGDLLERYYEDQIERDYKRPRQVRLYINRVPREIAAIEVADLNEQEAFRFRGGMQTWLRRYAVESGKIGANRMLSILKQATRYGVAAGKILIDPLAPLTKKQVGGQEIPRQRVLTDDEIRLVWNVDCDHRDLFQFLLLTGQRIGEAQLARFDHFHDDRWVIPAEHSKNGKEHWVPITDTLREIVDQQDKRRDLVFGYRSNTGVQAWLRRFLTKQGLETKEQRFTPHDLRRTVITGMNSIGIDTIVVEKFVNHSLSGNMKTYNRSEYEEQRFAAAERWASHLLEIIE